MEFSVLVCFYRNIQVREKEMHWIRCVHASYETKKLEIKSQILKYFECTTM